MIDSKNITFIGSGNLATNLALAFEKAGHRVNEVYSKKTENATLLADKLKDCKPILSLDLSKSASTIFIIAVSDSAISEVSDKLIVPGSSLVLHTSGTTNLDVLSKHFKTGIFYPLQTFNKHSIIEFDDIPILLESNEKTVELELEKLAKSISKSVQFVNSEDRKTIHLAAVFASNFTNRMLKASEEILGKKNIPLDILNPLVKRSIENSFSTSPDQALTGPAKRKDLETVNQHLEILNENPKLKEIYQAISNQILES